LITEAREGGLRHDEERSAMATKNRERKDTTQLAEQGKGGKFLNYDPEVNEAPLQDAVSDQMDDVMGLVGDEESLAAANSFDNGDYLQGVGHMLSGAGRTIADAAGEAYDTVADGVGEAYDEVSDFVGDAVDYLNPF